MRVKFRILIVLDVGRWYVVVATYVHDVIGTLQVRSASDPATRGAVRSGEAAGVARSVGVARRHRRQSAGERASQSSWLQMVAT